MSYLFCWFFICKLLWINYLGWERESYVVCYRILLIIWFLFGDVSSSSGCLGWAALFYCGTL